LSNEKGPFRSLFESQEQQSNVTLLSYSSCVSCLQPESALPEQWHQ
jgi:hypothetical protein